MREETTVTNPNLADPDTCSEKQLFYFDNSYAPVNIATGAVQSGKSYIVNIRFGYYVLFESPHSRFLLTGNTIMTVHRNVVDNGLLDFFNQVLGKENVHYSFGERILLKTPDPEPNKIVWIVGVNNQGATDKLKGQPIGGTLADEITTYPEEPADMMFARNSLPGALVFATTNPASHNHWAWRKYVGNTEKIEKGLVRVFEFRLYDNPIMTAERIAYYEDMFEGVFYERNVLGKWVMAEGAIYDMFNDELGKHIFAELPYGEPADYDDAFLAIDYGTGSVTTAAIWLVRKGTINNQYHCLAEWYYDARVERQRLTDDEIASNLLDFLTLNLGDLRIQATFIDATASSLIEELAHHTSYNEYGQEYCLFGDVLSQKMKVLKGITRMSVLMKQMNMRWHQSCVNTIREYQSYVWDKQEDDKPLKVDDHCPDRDRYGIMGYEAFLNYDENESFAVTGTGGRIMGDKYV